MEVNKVIETLARVKGTSGECPPEDLVPGKVCSQADDCVECWKDTVSKFLELDKFNENVSHCIVLDSMKD